MKFVLAMAIALVGYTLISAGNVNRPKVDNDYEPRGREYFVQELNMTVYDTALSNPSAPSRILILAYDRNGPHDHFRQIADAIAAGKGNSGQFRVLIPDFFRQGDATTWETGAGQDVRDIINYFRQSAENTFGIFGFCWGGRISVKAAQEVGVIRGAGLIHPSGVLTEDALTLARPVLLLPTSTDPDMDPFEAIVLDRLGLDSVFHRRFTDMSHGFAGSGGDWANTLVNLRVDQVIDYLVNFMNKHL